MYWSECVFCGTPPGYLILPAAARARRRRDAKKRRQDVRAVGLGHPPLLALPRAREAHRHLRADPSRCASSAVPPHDAAPHAAQGHVHSVRGGLPLPVQGQDRQVAARTRPGRRRHRKPRRLRGADHLHPSWRVHVEPRLQPRLRPLVPGPPGQGRALRAIPHPL